MKNKLFLYGVIAMLLVGIANAFTVVLDNPAASGTVIGNYNMNCTITGVVNDTLVNITYYAKSSSTANSSYALLATLNDFNVTDSPTPNASFVSTILEDANDYIFNVTVMNNTHNTAGDTSTSVVVDNTVPVAPSSPSPADEGTDTDGDVDFSVAVTGGRTTACTLNVEGTNYAMTHSGSTCTYSLTGLRDSSYGWYVIASDGTNATQSALWSVDVASGSGSAYSALKAIERKEKQDTSLITVGETVDTGKIKEWVKKEATKPELIKTGIGIAVGAGVGLIGGPLAFVTVPIGAVVGGLIGVVI